jgi:predicted nucleotidyltransferase
LFVNFTILWYKEGVGGCKMEQLKPEEKKIVREYIDLIRSRFSSRVREIILFGSRARGDSHSESDVDILIVMDTEDKGIKRQLVDLAWDVMSDNDFKVFISPVIFFNSQYNQYKKWNSSFLYNVFKEGIKI